MWVTDGQGTIANPALVLDNADVRVTMYWDVITFGDDGFANRSANMVQYNKARRDTTLLQPLAREPFTRTGNDVRIRHSGVCLGVVVCPEFEVGRFVGDTLFLQSRHVGFQELRYRAVVIPREG